MNWDRLLFRLVRINAAILLLAAPCALLPVVWMERIHGELLGPGSFPDAPITRYLARSLCLVYAMHGVVVLAASFDWPRYRSLVPFLALVHMGYGCSMALQDMASGMPWWWTLAEGPTITGYGVVVFLVARKANRVGTCSL